VQQGTIDCDSFAVGRGNRESFENLYFSGRLAVPLLPYSFARTICLRGQARKFSREALRVEKRFTGAMIRHLIAIAAFVLASTGTPVYAQDSLSERLAGDRLADVQSGAYIAGDNVKFALTWDGANFLLRFDGNPEVFVLYGARASMGGRELKYDSGETALQIAGWGGMTLYTDGQPGGLPAVRNGDTVAPSPANVSLNDMQNAASDEAEHLTYMRGLHLSFTADWSALSANGAVRSFAFDTMENAVRGLDRFSNSLTAREALVRKIDTVMIAISGKPALTLNGRTLIVTFNPARGYEGRASSRAIARALAIVFRK
jgi:hypothetical protein